MEKNNVLGLYVSYYLARFNEQAYTKLGYGTQNDTHFKVGKLLDVKPATIKNWRDEFDPLFGHRAGWYQRPMSKSRLAVVNALADLDETAVFELVKDILLNASNSEDIEMKQLKSVINDADSDTESTSIFVPRGPTGKAAEEFFIKCFNDKKTPLDGVLEDCRELGTGYDFKLSTETDFKFIEVKGRDKDSGGILFTNKEWNMAKKHGDNYIVCIVSHVSTNPTMNFLYNPAKDLVPNKYVYTSIQINWTISDKLLTEAFR